MWVLHKGEVKEMKWFKHDSDASSDAKIKKLLIRHGAVGYAVYFHCLELIAGNVSNDNITFELEHDSEIIADNLRIRGTAEKSGVEVVEEIMRCIVSLNLFENTSGSITCPKMIKRLDSSMTGNPQFRLLINKAKENQELLEDSHDSNADSHDTVMTQSIDNHDTVMLEENRIEENRREEKNIYSQFFELWNSKKILPKHKIDVVKSKWQKKHVDQIKLYGDEQVLKAIENYSYVLNNPKEYYFTHRWTFWDFIHRGLQQFCDEMNPIENFKKKSKNEKTRHSTEISNLGVDDYAGRSV